MVKNAVVRAKAGKLTTAIKHNNVRANKMIFCKTDHPIKNIFYYIE